MSKAEPLYKAAAVEGNSEGWVLEMARVDGGWTREEVVTDQYAAIAKIQEILQHEAVAGHSYTIPVVITCRTRFTVGPKGAME